MRKDTYLKHFDANEFQALHAEMQKGLASVKKTQVVAFVGMSGSGKSTTINYLLGNTLSKVTEGALVRYAVEGDSPSTAKIGHQQESKTLLPEMFHAEDHGATLLDTAGLNDTRGVNVKLSIALGLKKVAQATDIKGVVIVMNSEDLLSPRASGARSLIWYISQLTKEFDPGKFAFCVTNVNQFAGHDDSVITDTILDSAKKLATSIKEGGNEHDTLETKNDADDVIKVLNLMSLVLLCI